MTGRRRKGIAETGVCIDDELSTRPEPVEIAGRRQGAERSKGKQRKNQAQNRTVMDTRPIV